jgi:hypothetical protein
MKKDEEIKEKIWGIGLISELQGFLNMAFFAAFT